MKMLMTIARWAMVILLGMIIIFSIHDGMWIAALYFLIAVGLILPPLSAIIYQKIIKNTIAKRAATGFALLAGIVAIGAYGANDKNIAVETRRRTATSTTGSGNRREEFTYDENGNAVSTEDKKLESEYQYEILPHSPNAIRPEKNLLVLVDSGTIKGKEDLSRFISYVKAKECNDCFTIVVYDSRQASILDEEFAEYKNNVTEMETQQVIEGRMSPEEGKNYYLEKRKEWVKKNYTFLADHTVGWLLFDNGVDYYPLRSDEDYATAKEQ